MSKAIPMGRRALFSISGPDAPRYLNGQVTQDVRRLNEAADLDAALPACVTDAKGRLQALVYLFSRWDNSIWVEAPAELELELEPRLGRYLIADDAEIENVSREWELWHVVDAPEAPEGLARRSNRFGSGGYDLWLPPGESCRIPLLSEDEAETRRITARIPAWGRELTPGMLPPEAGLDRTAISYRKGCYIGQEVLSRIKSAGRLNRRLAAFLVDPGTPAGSSLGDGDRPAGTLTSVAPWPDENGMHAALGYLEKAAYGATELPLAGHSGSARVLGFA